MRAIISMPLIGVRIACSRRPGGLNPWLLSSLSKTIVHRAGTLLWFLRLSGYEVYEAEDGDAALSLLSRMQFDVVISDLNLPGQINGIDILDALKTIPRKIDAILVTGRGSDEIKRRANSLGAAYMEKPVQLRELKNTIEQRARR
jgi:DNA-binding response OmpR family regulator